MDVLEQVLNDPENQEHLKTALTKLLREDPVAFYKFIAMPRMQKLGHSPDPAGFVDMTPAEEAALMDELTTQVKAEHVRRKERQLTEAPA